MDVAIDRILTSLCFAATRWPALLRPWSPTGGEEHRARTPRETESDRSNLVYSGMAALSRFLPSFLAGRAMLALPLRRTVRSRLLAGSPAASPSSPREFPWLLLAPPVPGSGVAAGFLRWGRKPTAELSRHAPHRTGRGFATRLEHAPQISRTNGRRQ